MAIVNGTNSVLKINELGAVTTNTATGADGVAITLNRWQRWCRKNRERRYAPVNRRPCYHSYYS